MTTYDDLVEMASRIAPDLLSKLTFQDLVLCASGDCTVYLSAHGVFGEHPVQIDGHIRDGLISASL